MAKLREAKKISELDEALDFNNIAVDDGTPIGKRITKDRLKNLIGSEGAQLKAVQGGTVGNPTSLVAPETTEYRWMKASPGEYTFDGTPYSATVGKEWIFEWLSGTWSLKDMGALPLIEVKNSVINNLEAVSGFGVELFLKGLVVGNNIIPTTLSSGTFNRDTGAITASVNWLRTLPYTQTPNKSYTLNGIGATTNDANFLRVGFYKENGDYIGFLPSPGAVDSFTYTAPLECHHAIAIVDAGTDIGLDVPNSPYQQTFSITANDEDGPKLVAEKIKGKIETDQVKLLDSSLEHDNSNFKDQFKFTKDVGVVPYKKLALPVSSGINHQNFAVTKESDVSVISVNIDSIATNGSIRLGFGDENAAFQFIKTKASGTVIEIYFMSRFGVNLLSPAITIASTELSAGDKITLFRSGLGIYFYLNNVFLGFKDLKNQGVLSGHLGGVVGFRDNLATWVASNVQFKKRNSAYMHLSVDDCITSFQWITENSPASIFEDPRFSVYKELHDKYGACISLYTFYQNGSASFNLSQMPSTYKQEFIDNSSWLKIGFHGVDSTTDYTTIDTATGVEHYNRIVNQIYRFAGYSSIDNMPRFSMFKGNNALFEELKKSGLVGVLTADDSRTDNSGLNDIERSALSFCDDYYSYSRELYYSKSEYRLDTTNAVQVISQLEALYNSQNNKNVYEMFWHQNRELNTTGKEMIEAMCQWAVEKGIKFDFTQNNIFF